MSIAQLAQPSYTVRTLSRQGILQRHAFRLFISGQNVGRPVFRVNQFHSSCTRQKKAKSTKQAQKWIEVEENRMRAISGPRYPQGPTAEGLKIVVRALQAGPPQMHTREIWELIHERGIGLENSFPEPRSQAVSKDKARLPKPQVPEPTYPTHPVRSLKYLKVVLLKTLETNGRIRKVHTFRAPITPEEKIQVEMKNKKVADRNARKLKHGLDPKGLLKQGIGYWAWELIPVPEDKVAYEDQPNLVVSSLDQLWRREMRRKSNYDNASESGPSETDPHERSRELLSQTEDQAYGDKLASRWHQVTRRNLHTHLRAELHAPEKPQWKDFRSNPIEADNKEGDFAIGLLDARLRQHGFHYGLPKQKELLKAANARGVMDQEEWKEQPARDISHLSPRRQRTREEQTRYTLRSLNEIKKLSSRKRAAP